MNTIHVDVARKQRPIRGRPASEGFPTSLPEAKQSQRHPTNVAFQADASLFFVGTATTILEWKGLRLMTDPNFLHAGDHVHLGPGVTGTRQTNPAVDIEALPGIDLILLSHYHADHFDEKVEEQLRRDLPIVTTPHAKDHLANKGVESFTHVQSLDFWETLLVSFDEAGSERATKPQDEQLERQPQYPRIKVTGMPGTHVPPGALSVANDLLKAVPPTNGWMLELGHSSYPDGRDFNCGYRIYISGDTLMFDDLKKIPEMYTHAGKDIDLMLIHLGGTTIPSPKVPLLMVTMDAKMGIEMMQLMQPDMTIPIHYDDYDVFLSPLSDFQKAVEDAGLHSKVVYLDRGDEYKFQVKQSPKA